MDKKWVLLLVPIGGSGVGCFTIGASIIMLLYLGVFFNAASTGPQSFAATVLSCFCLPALLLFACCAFIGITIGMKMK